MLESPEVEAHRHHTGHSRVDLILGCLAVFMSMVSVFIAIRHGDTMERLVAANTWPNIEYSNSNDRADAPETITLDLRNTGVGPARIENLELFYKSKPMPSLRALADACCTAAAHKHGSFSYSTALGVVLPAREDLAMVTLHKDRNDPAFYAAFDQARGEINVRVCYCSVFDECWAATGDSPRPERVRQCLPSQPVQFQQ